MASLPKSEEIARKRDAISSSASFHEIRFHTEELACGGAAATGPLGPTLRIGYSTRSGEYTRSRYFATFAHKNPRVTGCSGSPWIFVARPSCTVIKTPHESGQSCGHTAFTTCFIVHRLYGDSRLALSCNGQVKSEKNAVRRPPARYSRII